jgi:cyclic pyranopterin phosphate synthase
MAGRSSPRLTHVDSEGRARMVDVSGKPATGRRAVARCAVRMAKRTAKLIASHALAKGDPLAVAELAGVQAAKRTSELIPLAHPLALTHIEVTCTLRPAKAQVDIVASARCRGETGVEMEALVAAAVAALTVYDMCKAVDRGMTITDLQLVAKSGGRSGTYRRRGG